MFYSIIFIAHARGDDRPFLNVSIYGETMLALFDSGSSRYLGSQGWSCLRSICPLKSNLKTRCVVANGVVKVWDLSKFRSVL